MSQLAADPVALTHSPSRHQGYRKAERPALIDLRFKGDAWVVENDDGTASLCLGNYSMLSIRVCSLDLPSLNRTLQNVRTGQARRLARKRKLIPR